MRNGLYSRGFVKVALMSRNFSRNKIRGKIAFYFFLVGRQNILLICEKTIRIHLRIKNLCWCIIAILRALCSLCGTIYSIIFIFIEHCIQESSLSIAVHYI